MKVLVFVFLLLPLSLSANELEFSLVSDERLVNAESEFDNWLSHGRTYAEARFSPLDQINKNNIDELSLAWSFAYKDRRGLEATPIVVDGVMYTSGTWSRVFAHNAKTGELLWEFDPLVDKAWGIRACCGPVNRGVAVWKDKVFVGSLDGYLVAIDKKSGKQVWRTLTIDKDMDYSITGAPRVVKGQVVIGNGGAEYRVRGYVSAYDAETGELNWRFHTVPGNPADGFESDAMKLAAETWTGEWWKLGGGGTVWDSMSFDPELNLLYIGVGNGSPWNQVIRSPEGGDNFFLSSIVALNPDTGEYVWHYQTTPAESWDFTATQQMTLADIEWQGKVRKVLMQAPKNGFFFIIDRETGEFLSAEPFTNVVWAKAYDENGRPIENEGVRYKDDTAMMMPGAIGGHNWHSMSYSLDTGLVYIPVLKGMMPYSQPKKYKDTPHHMNPGADLSAEIILNQHFIQAFKFKAIRGELLAWDPLQQKQRWRFKHNSPWNGGILSTAGGLVFQGTADQKFMAFDDETGEVLWEYDTKLGIIAAPVSYRVDGEQYVAVLAKWGGAFPMAVGVTPKEGLDMGRLLVFKLGGKAELPPVDMLKLKMENKPKAMTITDQDTLEGGRIMFMELCSGCHGNDAVSSRNVPDLRYKVSQYDYQTFKLFLMDGVLSERGMVAFDDILSEDDAKLLYNYILREAHLEYEKIQNQGLIQDIEFVFYDYLSSLAVEAAQGTVRFYAGVALFWTVVIGLIVIYRRRA